MSFRVYSLMVFSWWGICNVTCVKILITNAHLTIWCDANISYKLYNNACPIKADCTTWWGVLLPPIKIRCHENPHGNSPNVVKRFPEVYTTYPTLGLLHEHFFERKQWHPYLEACTKLQYFADHFFKMYFAYLVLNLTLTNKDTV